MGPQRPNLTNLDPVFVVAKSGCQYIGVYEFGERHFFGSHFNFFGRQNLPFLRVLVKMSGLRAVKELN